MVTLVLALVLAQQPALKVAVIDVSDSDAIYEDVSRSLTEEVVKALAAAGFDAHRVDESELPEGGCQTGPCLEKVVRAQKAQLLVTVDAKELAKPKLGVGLVGLWGRDGAPLAGVRYTLKPNRKKAPKELLAFAADLLEKANALARPSRPDAGK